MATIKLTALPRWAKGAHRWTERQRLVVLTEPVLHGQACVHLALNYPHGLVVIASRGPRGGWTGATYVRSSDTLPWPAPGRALYLAWIA